MKSTRILTAALTLLLTASALGCSADLEQSTTTMTPPEASQDILRDPQATEQTTDSQAETTATQAETTSGSSTALARPSFISSELAVVWPWEYQTTAERYSTLTFEDMKYLARGRTLGTEWIEGELGIGESRGYDTYEKRTYWTEFPIYKIKHISQTHLIAAYIDGEYYVYKTNDTGVPDTLGELLDEYALSQTLPLTDYTVYEQANAPMGYYTTGHGDAVWQILASCRDAKSADNDYHYYKEHPHLCFTATSEPLGIYKCAFYVVEEGYIWTNICDYAAAYEIGPEAAAAIIAAVRRDEQVNDTPEMYQTTLCGTITEIGEDYFLLDDSKMCTDPNEGTVYRIMIDDIRIRRYFEFPTGGVKVGNTVAVSFEGELSIGENNTLTDALRITRGHIITDWNMLIE